MNGTTSSNETLIRLAARRLQNIDVTAELKEKTVHAVLDYIGAIASGLKALWASNAIRYAQSQGGPKEAHAWGLEQNVSAKTAAYVNALLAHRYNHRSLMVRNLSLTKFLQALFETTCI